MPIAITPMYTPPPRPRAWWSRARHTVLCGILILFWGFAIGGQSACTVGADCKYDTDCPLDSLCKEGHCDTKPDGGNTTKPECQQDKECPNTHFCIQNRCRPIAPFETSQPDASPDQSADNPPTETITPPNDGDPTDLPDATPSDQDPPAKLGPTPIHHAINSGASISSSSKFKHIAIVGQACPVAPASTVTRSNNFSARVGVIAVTLW